MKQKTWGFKMAAPRRAEVLIYGDIGDAYFGGCTSKAFVEELRALGELDDLDVRINSRGGLIYEGFAIYETLRQHKAEVHIKIDGLAASIASLIAMAGDTIAISQSGFMMIHRAWNICIGDADEMRATAGRLEMMESKIMDAYLRRAKELDRAELFNMLKAETWMDAERCKELGFVDEVIKPEKDVAMAFDLSLFKHPPANLVNTGPAGEVAELQRAQREEQDVAVRLRLLDVTGG